MSDIMDKLTAYQLDPENEAVQAYFEKDNIWTILDIQRYEPSHSAFLVWFFSQKFKRYVQIRNLLLLLIKKAKPEILKNGWNKTSDMESFASAIIAGSFSINSVSVMPEYVVKKLSKIKSVDRIDIFIRCSLTLYDKKGKEEEKSLEIFIENKVDSAEGDEKGNNKHLPVEYKSKKQTERYFYACSISKDKREQPNPDFQLFVFLTPDGKESASIDYVLITYQDLVDYIFENILKRTDIQQDVIDLIDSYLRNLGNPYNKNNKDIIAMEQEERNLLVKFFNRNEELFKATIRAKILEADENGEADVRKEFQNIEKSLKNTRKKYYSIDGQGKYRMFHVLEEYIKKCLESGEKFADIQQRIDKNVGKTIISDKANGVKIGSSGAKPHEFEVNGTHYYVTKELSDKEKIGNSNQKGNFFKFREMVEGSDFLVKQIVEES